MKLFLTTIILSLLFSVASIADSTTVKMCYSGEIGLPFNSTIDKEINRFDSSGRLIQNENNSFEFYIWGQVDTAFRLVSRTDYGYNNSGLIDTVLETHVNVNGPYYYRYNYLYDISGNLIEKIRFYGLAFPLDSNHRTINQYDSNNNILSQREEQYVANQYRTSILYKWFYDSQDRNVEYRKINFQGINPSDSLVDTYTYSASDKILSKKEVVYDVPLDSTYYEYVYDSNDSLIKYTNYNNSTSTSWIPWQKNVYSYSIDTTVKLLYMCPDTACSDTTSRLITINDTSGHIINNLLDDYNFGSWEYVSRETHDYNVLGNIVDYYSRSVGLGCSFETHTTYDYNTSEDLIHAYTYRYHCNEYYSDCYYYNVDSDSILVLIDYNDTTCSNSPAVFAITVEGGVPPYQYDWTPGNFLSDSTVMYPRIINLDTTITYTLLITDAMGRTASDTMKLFGYPNLYVPVSIVSFGLPCENNSFHLTMDTIPRNYNFKWTIPNIGLSYGDTILAVNSGTYNLFLTDSNGCSYSYSTIENLFPQPVVSLGADTLICLNDTMILDAGNFVQYQWNTGDVSQTIEVYSSSPVVDSFFVLVTDTNGCTNSDTISVEYAVCLGQNEIVESGIKVNYCRNQIQIELPSSIPFTQFTVIDITGRTIINKVVYDEQIIETTNLSSGVYVFYLSDYRGKIVKE